MKNSELVEQDMDKVLEQASALKSFAGLNGPGQAKQQTLTNAAVYASAALILKHIATLHEAIEKVLDDD